MSAKKTRRTETASAPAPTRASPPPAGALRFSNPADLLAAIAADRIPHEVASRPASVWREGDGALLVSFAEADRAALAKVTATIADVPSSTSETVGSWAEIVRPCRRPEPAEIGEVIFTLEDEASLFDLASELLRLGCDRQELCVAGPRFLLRAMSPPYYTVARALDGVAGARAFVRHAATLTEIGWAHPLATQLRPADGHELFIQGDGGFFQLPLNGAWRDVYRHARITLPPVSLHLTARAPATSFEVPLRLARTARSHRPSLWVLREGTEKQLDALVQSLPHEILERLLFACATTADGETVAVLKARPGPNAPELDVDGTAHAPVLQLANLFAPVGTVLQPALRGDVVRELLAADPAILTWIDRADDGRLSRTSLPLAAFAPLAEWVDYVMDRGRVALEPWIRAATFAFEDFETTEDEAPPISEDGEASRVDRTRTKPAREETIRPAKRRRARTKEPTDVEDPAPPVVAPAARDPNALAAAARTPDDARLVNELAAVERSFLDLAAPADAPERRSMWVEMARINGALRRKRDAGLSWTRAIWDADAKEEASLAAQWAAAETHGSELTSLLALANPDRDQIRAVAAAVATSGSELRDHVALVSQFLDRREDDLDVRSLWLARLALSRAAGGDRLGLARAREKVLAKLARGVSLERDVPTFLRFVGPGLGGESATRDRLVRELSALRERYTRTHRVRSAVEAKGSLTDAYVDLTFAYGFARFGQIDRARQLTDTAWKALDLADAVHGFLARAYKARVEQAMEGAALESALPAELTGELNRLDRFPRYKVDRLRQASMVLEAQERLDPMRAFHRGEADPRGGMLMGLRGEADAARLGAGIARLFALAKAAPPDERAQLFDGLMDFFPRLPESQAAPHLEEIVVGLEGIPAPRASQLLEEALMLAGHFGRAELVQRIVRQLTPLLAHLDADHIGEASSMVATTQRALRRVGLKDEAAGLVEALGRAASGPGVPMQVARLALAGASFALKHDAKGRAAIDETQALLSGDLVMADRLLLVRAAARAVTSAPEELALSTLGLLAAGLPKITDSFNTNSHFCLSVVTFMESLILGYAAEELALGDIGRQWLDDDEALVRRRVHRDRSI